MDAGPHGGEAAVAADTGRCRRCPGELTVDARSPESTDGCNRPGATAEGIEPIDTINPLVKSCGFTALGSMVPTKERPRKEG